MQAFRNKSVTPTGPTSFRIVDWFSNGQVRNGTTNAMLRKLDDDHLEFGSLRLQRASNFR